MAKFSYIHGDIFNMDTDAIVNTVNCIGAYGKGLALSFHRHYPENTKLYKQACHDGNVKIGKMFMTNINGKHIVNFPTKNDWRNPSSMSYISSGLIDLAYVIDAYKIKSIAIPPLGCGLGGLKWPAVRDMIEARLNDCDCHIILLEQ